MLHIEICDTVVQGLTVDCESELTYRKLMDGVHLGARTKINADDGELYTVASLQLYYGSYGRFTRPLFRAHILCPPLT